METPSKTKKIFLYSGSFPGPDLIIRTPAEVWLAISRGQLNGQEAFMRKAYTAEGDLGLLMSLKKIFNIRRSAETGENSVSLRAT